MDKNINLAVREGLKYITVKSSKMKTLIERSKEAGEVIHILSNIHVSKSMHDLSNLDSHLQYFLI